MISLFYLKNVNLLHFVRLTFGLSFPVRDDAVELMLVDCFFMSGLGGGASSSSSLKACFLLDPVWLYNQNIRYPKTIKLPSIIKKDLVLTIILINNDEITVF